MTWTIEFFNKAVQTEIDSWPKGIRTTFARISQRMKSEGPNLGMPFTRAFGNGLFEIRAMGMEGIGRAFFCLIVNRKVVILHVYIKKTDKTPTRELEIAHRRMQEMNHGQ